MEQHVNSIGLKLGESDYCVSVRVGETPLYLHGTCNQIRELAAEIIAAADHYERTAIKMAAEMPEVDA